MISTKMMQIKYIKNEMAKPSFAEHIQMLEYCLQMLGDAVVIFERFVLSWNLHALWSPGTTEWSNRACWYDDSEAHLILGRRRFHLARCGYHGHHSTHSTYSTIRHIHPPPLPHALSARSIFMSVFVRCVCRTLCLLSKTTIYFLYYILCLNNIIAHYAAFVELCARGDRIRKTCIRFFSLVFGNSMHTARVCVRCLMGDDRNREEWKMNRTARKVGPENVEFCIRILKRFDLNHFEYTRLERTSNVKSTRMMEI